MWHPESIYDAGGHLDEGVVHAWLDGQLAPEAATQVEAHAAGCAPCSGMVAEARGLIAGASRVMAALDDPAVGQGPARDAMIGIVSAAGAARRPGGARATGPRWSIRRVSYAAAAAFVLVAAALVLRDSGSVREMVQADQRVTAGLGEASLGDSTAVQPEASSDAAVAPVPPSAPEGAQAVADSPPAADAASAGRVAGRAGSAAGSATPEPGFAFRSPVAPAAGEPDRAPPRPQAATGSVRQRVEASSPPPAPASTPAATTAPSRSRAAEEVVVTGIAGGRAVSNQAGKAAADAAGETRAGTIRTSAEIQAMVRMMSSCWRIAASDSVVDLLPPAGPSAGLWIAGWLRVGRDDTNPERIWWRPLVDSVSARVRLDGEASQDLVITQRAGAGQLRRVARADSLATWESIPRGAPAESATAVRCAFP